jgi:hypothetical protein
VPNPLGRFEGEIYPEASLRSCENEQLEGGESGNEIQYYAKALQQCCIVFIDCDASLSLVGDDGPKHLQRPFFAYKRPKHWKFRWVDNNDHR